MSQEHYVKPQKNARAESCDVSLVIADRQIADEEKAHSGDAKDDGDKIPQVKFLANNKRGEYQYIYGSRVLQENGVGSSRVFRRPDE